MGHEIELTMAEHDCHSLLASLSAYVDGELDEAICREIEAHMAICENCRIVVDTLQKTIRLYRTAPDPELPEMVRARLYTTLRLDNFLPRK